MNYCNKCNREVKLMNELELDELEENGSFVCSNCINEEMQERTIDNFIIYWTSDEAERIQMRACLKDYLEIEKEWEGDEE